MKLIKLPAPRPGQLVQCCQCLKMIEADKALCDLDGEHFKAYYHPQCTKTPWEFVEERGGYWLWKYEDRDNKNVYNVTQNGQPPKNNAGYYSYGYLLKVKGLLKGATLNSIFNKENEDNHD